MTSWNGRRGHRSASPFVLPPRCSETHVDRAGTDDLAERGKVRKRELGDGQTNDAELLTTRSRSSSPLRMSSAPFRPSMTVAAAIKSRRTRTTEINASPGGEKARQAYLEDSGGNLPSRSGRDQCRIVVSESAEGESETMTNLGRNQRTDVADARVIEIVQSS